jgi:hypothetical protein
LTFVRSSFNNTADPVHKSEVLLVRTSDSRESPWNAVELEGRLGLTQPSRDSGPDTR